MLTPTRPRSAYFVRGFFSMGDKPLAVLLATTLLLVLAGVFVLPPLIARSVRTQLDAETRLQALTVTAQAIRVFADTQDPPRWPSSWDELATVTFTDHAWIHWPRDRALIEEHVTVDFGMRLDAALSTDVGAVDFIRPNGTAFTGWQHDVRSILASP